ncbi:uncharacterized protein LOC128102520 [Peromyscus californicus insignis]|uniref:uncharacterized protein LOC128102520 n=1 Tax=Peromyscus californicus insignis TaxID=564181 RepID=UPI0022A6631E|nr:uncharacterized protein LOC128102520 [Peromyscus californicus insignis]
MVMHAFSPGTQEAEAGGSLSLRPAYRSSEQIPGQQGLHRETLSQKNKQTKNKREQGIVATHQPASFLDHANLEGDIIAIQPADVQHGLVGEIKCFWEKGLHLVAITSLLANEELLKRYETLTWKTPFLPGLVEYINSGPVVAMEHHSWQ